MQTSPFKKRARTFLSLALCSLLSIATLAAKTSKDTVDYFTDNGFGNAVGPAGIHHEGVTYVAYQGPAEDAWIASYNHDTGEWLGPFLAGVSALGKGPDLKKIDNHGKPDMVIDDEGYIHITYGGHGGTPAHGKNPLGNHHAGEMRHVVTQKPLDITSWERLDNVPPFGTYSEFIKMDNGDIYHFYRHGAHRSNWVYQRSTDNARTFEEPVSIVLTKRRADIAANDSWYLAFEKAPGDKIAARVYYHICKDAPHDGERQNGYYIEMDTKDHVWRNIHGEALETPLTKEYADQHALVVNTGEKWVHGGPLALDSEGHPHFLLYLGDDTGHVHGGPKVVHHYRWTGQEWTSNGGNPQMPRAKGNLQVSSPENVHILLADKNDEGTGEVVWWNSSDGGETFEKGETYFSVPKSSVQISGFIENAHPAARILVATAKGRTDFRNLYLVGDNGPIQRKSADAALLTEAQKAQPKVGAK